jgi:hypothetical protein
MEDNTPVQRITEKHIKIVVGALNAAQDVNVSSTAKDYDWYSRSGSTQRMYTLTRGDEIVIQGMHVADFYFACNAIAQTILDVTSLGVAFHIHALAKQGYSVTESATNYFVEKRRPDKD